MADERNQPNSHWSNREGLWRTETSNPTNPNVGDMYYNISTNYLCYYTGNNWVCAAFT